MTDLLDISLKYIKDVDGLLSLREKIHKKIVELKNNLDDNDNILTLLKKKYFNISNKINYIKKRETIIERNREKNRTYIVNNYEKIKQYNKNYQRNRRVHYKELVELFDKQANII